MELQQSNSLLLLIFKSLSNRKMKRKTLGGGRWQVDKIRT
jgi:hypothetical protein